MRTKQLVYLSLMVSYFGLCIAQNQGRAQNKQLVSADNKHFVSFDEKKSSQALEEAQFHPFYGNKHLKLSAFQIGERMQALNAGNSFPFVYNAVTERFIRVYLRDHAHKIDKWQQEAPKFMPMIEKTLREHDLPRALKYLAVVESGLDPLAKSSSDAVGLWQFKEATARSYGLVVSAQKDERYDAELSTRAACRYLKALYLQFEDWELVLAAYNAGPSAIQKLVQNKAGRDYWSLRKLLPSQTQSYLPSFQAIAFLLEQQDADPTPKTLLLHQGNSYRVGCGDNLEGIASKFGISLETLKDLNQLVTNYLIEGQRLVIDKNPKKNYPLAMTEGNLNCFSNGDSPDRQGIYHLVHKGETLYGIARNLEGVSVKQLKKWNGLGASSYLKEGMYLRVQNPISQGE